MDKKKGGIKIHAVIKTNEGILWHIQFTLTNYQRFFILVSSKFFEKGISAMDGSYINYEKFKELTVHNVVFFTKKKNLSNETLFDIMDMIADGKKNYREQVGVFRKRDIRHIARIASGVATMVRILLLYYFNIQTFSNKSDGGLKLMLMEAYELPPEEVENNKRAYL